MHQPELSKQSLGTGYVVATGVALSLALVAHAVTALSASLTAMLVVLAGIVPALVLVGANQWVPRSGLEGAQVWTVAEWGGLGVGLVTLVHLAISLSGDPAATMRTAILASSVAFGGFVGILVGTVIELRRSRRRLAQSNDVLNRVLRHDLRNRLNVVLGHLDELERTASVETATDTAELRQSIEDLLSTTEKARQIDVALGTDQRDQGPRDLVAAVESRLDALERATPAAAVERDLPDEALVRADWLLGTVLDNLVENTVVHSETAPSLSVSVEADARTTTLELVDDCPSIPQAELDVFSARAETPLQHSKGVGLWLVIWVVESYDGSVAFERTPDGGNVVRLEFRTATWLDRHR
ncbi:HAMP domain-containing sensor histidine kinase [Haloarcula onubensis]|uniref:histidine kinase n=1 Tax=Haloarcula onubensis TaxID=2950539 RepID=A0ABU2FJR8_9EURY|nr:HAMP domain-containing sensor histidine kinase [Halomicroarcula sp. S3CR25-11]MDS0281000.1 HAMP domain-containing histidine kinase [Halomicroarcula sp. S3CR25-11]